jgi:hypothetical protein
MESASSNKSEGFFKYYFTLDSDDKNDITNAMQYLVLMLVPAILLEFALIHYLFPCNENDKKSTWKLLGEAGAEFALALLGIIFIDRAIRYIPTYSGVTLSSLNYIQLLVGMLIFKSTFDGAPCEGEGKIKILHQRLLQYLEDKKNDNSVVKVHQPISRGGVPTHKSSRADYISKYQNMEPSPQKATAGPTGNQNYGGPLNPLINADWPSSGGAVQEGIETLGAPIAPEPVAANGVLGGFSGSSW